MCTNRMSNIGMRDGKEEGRRGKEREGRQKRQREEGETEERERRKFHSTIPSNRHSNQLTGLATKK